MSLFVLSGQQSDVLYVDGLKIGIITKLSSAIGELNVFSFIFLIISHQAVTSGSYVPFFGHLLDTFDIFFSVT